MIERIQQKYIAWIAGRFFRPLFRLFLSDRLPDAFGAESVRGGKVKIICGCVLRPQNARQDVERLFSGALL